MPVRSSTPRPAIRRRLTAAIASSAVLFAGCATRLPEPAPSPSDPAAAPLPSAAKAPAAPPSLPRAGSGRGGYYLDDGPGDATPEGLLETPDAEPKVEPYSTRGNKPYVVFGKTYTPFTDNRPFRQSGIGSWYGRKFHGQKTSSGELYDMYKMTAAHPTLPIPSYVRVTNQNNGRQVIVRVNDRGPFLHNRVIDLSYTAALKLGYLEKGSGMLLVERLLEDDILRMADERRTRQAGVEPARNASAPSSAAAGLPAQPTGEAMAMEVSLPTIQSAALATEGGALSASAASVVAPAVPIPPAAASPSSQGRERVAAGPPQPVPNAQTARGVYLQFGAYAREANALAARGKLLQELAGVVPALSAVIVDGLHRLHAGPYADRAAAQEALRLVQQKSSVRPMIVER